MNGKEYRRRRSDVYDKQAILGHIGIQRELFKAMQLSATVPGIYGFLDLIELQRRLHNTVLCHTTSHTSSFYKHYDSVRD